MTDVERFLELVEAYRLTLPEPTPDEARALRIDALETLVRLTANAEASPDQVERGWHALLQLRLLYEHGLASHGHLEQARRDAGDIQALADAMAKLADRWADANDARQARSRQLAAEARRLQREGLIQDDIAEQLGISSRWVSTLLNDPRYRPER